MFKIEDNEKPNMFVYWQDKMPDYIKLCYKTIERNSGCNIHYVTDSNLFDYLPDLRKDLTRLHMIANQCDYLRLKLLQKYGGIYLDSDCIMFRSLQELYDNFMKSENVFCGIRDHGHFVHNGFMLAKPNAPILNKTINHIDGLLDEYPNKTDFGWISFGGRILKVFVDNLCVFVNKRLVIPIDYIPYKKNVPIDSFVNENTYCFMLWNHQFGIHQDKELSMTEKELLNCDMLIGQLFRRALK